VATHFLTSILHLATPYSGSRSSGTDFSRAGLDSALGHLGELDQARRVWRELKEINPKYSFREPLSRQPFRQEVERVAEGLTKAGLPN
jgi:adenylate cyclase